MNDYTRITVPLSKAEFIALRAKAGNEYRHPRDHARYLLRAALGLTGNEVETANRDALDSDPRRVTAAS